MRVVRISLSNYRNYRIAAANFDAGKNIIIGENAQGKSNLLELIEVGSTGKSGRAEADSDLICWQENGMHFELEYESSSDVQSISFAVFIDDRDNRVAGTSGKTREQMNLISQPNKQLRTKKIIKVNGVTQKSLKGLLNRLVCVSFTSLDLNLLRAGPKFRRDWLDNIVLRLKPSYNEILTKFNKTIAQRNKLLKLLAEAGKITVSNQDELTAWDTQAANLGSTITKKRLLLLKELLPYACEYQSHLSGGTESLSVNYALKALEQTQNVIDNHRNNEEDDWQTYSHLINKQLSFAELLAISETELANMFLKLMKSRRYLELRLKQSLIGPHRDDIVFYLNGADACSFASQGQQRSIVLALKLAEIKKITTEIGESPVLLLDDVLAELDQKRQALLLDAVTDDMQTIVTTTHLAGFDPQWLTGAKIMRVVDGEICFNEQAELNNQNFIASPKIHDLIP